MGNTKPRHNAKGRATALPAKERARARRTTAPALSVDALHSDGVASIESRKQLETRALVAENEDGGEKISKKRKKRLEAYIDRKLKKERRVDLLKGLEKSQATIQNPLALISTSRLNSYGKIQTQQEQLTRHESVEKRRRERARGVLEGHRRNGGYHSNSESDGEGEGKGKGKGKADSQLATSAQVLTAEARQDIISPASIQPHTVLKAFITSVPSRSNALLPSATAVGSALAPGVTVVVRASTAKRRRTAPAPRLPGSGSDFEPESEMSNDIPDNEESAISQSEEEWEGCQILSDNDPGVDEDGASQDNYGDEGVATEPAELDSDTIRQKGSFRDWAITKLKEAEGKSDNLDEAPFMTLVPSSSKSVVERHAPTGMGPLGEKLEGVDTPLYHQKTTHIPVIRPAKVKESRTLLPIVAEEMLIMDAIKRNPVVIVCGETGSGKTTQVPQFLYEAGFGNSDSDNPGMIGVTQPRRVAALSMARRVEEEMGLVDQGIVSHQIRYDTTLGPKTQIKFMTDGVLLREIANDILLQKYSVVIIDEAHERSVNTDVLIGLLSRIVKTRLEMWQEVNSTTKPLRLIIMSATLRVSDFSENKTLFPIQPPIVNVTTRQHPVVNHFNRVTGQDYVEEAYKKVCKIHTRLPPGGILVFLTGQREIVSLCQKLERRYGQTALRTRQSKKTKVDDDRRLRKKPKVVLDEDESGAGRPIHVNANFSNFEVEDLELATEQNLEGVEDGEVVTDPEALDTDDEGLDVDEAEMDDDDATPMHILPLYALLSSEQQMKVFKTPPDNARLVVVATNVAETSLTIPNIRYVVDSGRSKERQYDLDTRVQKYQISWISKASASQRSGRAGRTGPGHCYRLYSSAVFEHFFEQHSKPEILRTPIEGVVLQMKAMGLDLVVNFPFPTAPDRQSLQNAEDLLVHLGALKRMDTGWKTPTAQITDVGRAMSEYPLSPRLARLLVSGNQCGCLPYVIAIVSILSVGDPFIRDDALTLDDADVDTTALYLIRSAEERDKEVRKVLRRAYFGVQRQFARLSHENSDILKTLAVVGAYEFDGGRVAFCRKNFLAVKPMEEIRQLRQQISRIVEVSHSLDAHFSPTLAPPSSKQCTALRQLMTSAFVDQVAVRVDLVDKAVDVKHEKDCRLAAYRIIGLNDNVYIHPSSILYQHAPAQFVVYEQVQRTSNKIWLKGLTVIDGNWLPILAKSMCTLSQPKAGQLTAGDECDVIPKFGGSGLDVALDPIRVRWRKRTGDIGWEMVDRL